MMSDIVVRRAEADDAADLARCHVAAWRWAYRGVMPDELLDSLSVEPRRLDHWLTTIEGDTERVWVAERGGTVVGFASVGRNREDDLDEAVQEMYTLYLLQEVQGRGVGRALMDTVVGYWRRAGVADACLWVAEQNQLGRRFYERAGWVEDGARAKHPVGSGEIPIVRYRLNLGP